uniref:G_PROTEIN_RECEP_F1_2 domain-containing protein n=1 Tax=Steinernema glaseri TaxID=37863 RepID=A0A1I7YP10_9BILA
MTSGQRVVFETIHTSVHLTVILLSIFCVKSGLCRIYALNQSFVGILVSSVDLVFFLADLIPIPIPILVVDNVKTRWFYFIVVVLSQYATFTYRVFSTLMVLLTYLSCAQPFRFSQFMTERRIMQVFFAGHGAVMVLVALALPRVVEGIVIKGNIYIDGVTFLTYFAYVKQFLLMCLLVIMIILYVKILRQLARDLSTPVSVHPKTIAVLKDVQQFVGSKQKEPAPFRTHLLHAAQHLDDFDYPSRGVYDHQRTPSQRHPPLQGDLRDEQLHLPARREWRREQEFPEKCAKDDAKWIPTAERRLIFKDTKLERRICLDWVKRLL